MEEPSRRCPKITRWQERLIPAQSCDARQFLEERLAAMLSTVVSDEVQAEADLRRAYEVVGMEPPPIRWFDSPLAFVRAHAASFLCESLTECLSDRRRGI